jgi:tRNA 2-thiouridine synthesizing protein A
MNNVSIHGALRSGAFRDMLPGHAWARCLQVLHSTAVFLHFDVTFLSLLVAYARLYQEIILPLIFTHSPLLKCQGEQCMNCDKELDVRGLICPLPILRTKKSLVDMASGQILKIIATDPGAAIDFEVFADQTGNKLLASSETAGEFMFFMKKK